MRDARSACLVAGCIALTLSACVPSQTVSTPELVVDPATIATLVGRLDLERYKATIKGLTQFGDRLQGTDRNRAAIDWIESQLKSYGCTNTERLRYEFPPPSPPAPTAPVGTPPQ